MHDKVIRLDATIRNKENRVLIRFGFDEGLIALVKQLPDIRWDSADKAWQMPNTKENVNRIFLLFRGKAWIDYSALKSQKTENKPARKDAHAKMILPKQLNEEVLRKLEQFGEWLQSRRYGENTIKTYTDALRTFLRFHHSVPPDKITNDHIIKFNVEYIAKGHYSAAFQNQVVNAVKLFFSKIENTVLDLKSVHRPRREKLLPNVLSKQEVKAILDAPKNIKHKAMLSLIYSCGLRRSELLNLKITDIDSKRGLVIIKQSKGKKDRVVPLGLKILQLLREYYLSYKPKKWLFEGQNKEEQYSEQSLGKVLKMSVESAGIRKPVSLHWLRHSYATHLLENGTDLRYIQEILGHSSSRTTEIYTHVSTKNLQQIKSPFDDL
ncbi:site-specific integrase [bacterium]|nr:site-specific integrase [bacterium]NUN45768.1 site-specific integrase [bacterium]